MKENQNKKSIRHDPLDRHALIVRVIALSSFWFYEISLNSDSIGIIVLFIITIFTVLNHYVSKSSTLIFFEALFIGILSVFNPYFTILFTFPVFEAMLQANPYLLIVGGLLILVGGELSFVDVLFYLFSTILGSLYSLSEKERTYYKRESDHERRKRYEIERLNQEYLSIQEEIHNMAELSERDRIAQELHDDVGHELTGAVLSLQALMTILEDYNLSPNEIKRFEDMQKRVNQSAKSLRESVYRLKPLRMLGVHELYNIIEEYEFLPIRINIYGNHDWIPAHYWLLLKTILQEGLTNIMRYSNPKEVKLQLDITTSLVRFELENDGVIDDIINQFNHEVIEGMGHRNLKLRAKAYGGNFSAIKLSRKNSFRIVAVLPLKKEGSYEG